MSLAEYAGKFVLVVNTATRCVFTPQYTGLAALYEETSRDDLEILDFPCNQFAAQAPETDREIDEFCKQTYGAAFPRFAKIDVNGSAAAPLFVWLRQEKPEDEGSEATAFATKARGVNPPHEPGEIVWNFTKFLIDRHGHVIRRYSPTVRPNELCDSVLAEIAKNGN